jgi:hypothetical protein
MGVGQMKQSRWLRQRCFCVPVLMHSSELDAFVLKHKSLSISAEALFLSVGKTGFEPATPWSQTKCATGLRYFPFHYNLRYKYFKPVLYQKELS